HTTGAGHSVSGASDDAPRRRPRSLHDALPLSQERTAPELAAEEFWRGWYELLPRISAALGEREPHRIEYELTELVARIHPDLQFSVDRGERAVYSLVITGQEDPALRP